MTSVAVAVCTRNRGDQIVPTVESILASDFEDFTLVVADQSTSSGTVDALSAFDDERLRHEALDTSGLSRARNWVVENIDADLVIWTDDDCVVDPGWVAATVEALEEPSRPAMVFADVVAGPSSEGGFIPESVGSGDLLLLSLDELQPASDGVNVGIGAAMGTRRDAVLAAGGFSEELGAGAPFHAAEETELALRFLLDGQPVRRLTGVGVLHHGERSFDESRTLARRSSLGLGVAVGKLLRRRPRLVLPVAARILWLLVGRDLVASLRRFERPPVLGRLVYFVRGLAVGAAGRGVTTPSRLAPT